MALACPWPEDRAQHKTRGEGDKLAQHRTVNRERGKVRKERRDVACRETVGRTAHLFCFKYCSIRLSSVGSTLSLPQCPPRYLGHHRTAVMHSIIPNRHDRRPHCRRRRRIKRVVCGRTASTTVAITRVTVISIVRRNMQRLRVAFAGGPSQKGHGPDS